MATGDKYKGRLRGVCGTDNTSPTAEDEPPGPQHVDRCHCTWATGDNTVELRVPVVVVEAVAVGVTFAVAQVAPVGGSVVRRVRGPVSAMPAMWKPRLSAMVRDMGGATSLTVRGGP